MLHEVRAHLSYLTTSPNTLYYPLKTDFSVRTIGELLLIIFDAYSTFRENLL